MKRVNYSDSPLLSPNAENQVMGTCSFPGAHVANASSPWSSRLLEQGHLYHFSRFYMYALLYNIWFSLSDLFHSVCQSLVPSMSLQMT